MFKRKMIAPLVAILLCVGMVSVGFAAWVITSTDTKEIKEGAFTVYSVDNNSVTIAVAFADSAISWGGTAYTGQKTQWLTIPEAEAQDLNASMTITINEWSTLSANNKTVLLEIGAVSLDANPNNFTNSNYIVMPGAQTLRVYNNGSTWVVQKKSGETWVASDATISNGVVTVPLTFAWGTAFDTQNPINYFNDMDNTAANRNAADTALTNLYKLNGATYKLTVTASVAA